MSNLINVAIADRERSKILLSPDRPVILMSLDEARLFRTQIDNVIKEAERMEELRHVETLAELRGKQ